MIIMIPKAIHYCRFWWPKPQLVLDCIKSRKVFCPDWTIIEWNESNCDLTINERVKWAANKKKWAFVADYFRLKILYENWGIYIDADTKILRNIDELIKQKSFIWFHKRNELSIWFLGAEKNNKDIKILLEYYHIHKFKEKTINEIVTDYFVSQGLTINGKEQHINEWHIYPSHYVSIDIWDGSAFVEDCHMNSWAPIVVNNKPLIYLENLAARDENFSYYFDEYVQQITSSNQQKAWWIVLAILKFFWIDRIYVLYKKTIRRILSLIKK